MKEDFWWLANYLQSRNTEYYCTMRSNRHGLPNTIKSEKLKSAVNEDGIRVFKYKDKKDVYMASIFHGTDMAQSRRGGTVNRPEVILDYNWAKGGIDLLDQIIAYYSPAQKSVKWYRKVLFECIDMAVLNAWILHTKYYNQQKMKLAAFTKSIEMSLLGVTQSEKQKKKAHDLTNIPRKSDGKLVQKRCHGCYKIICKDYDCNTVAIKAKQVSTEYITCQQAFCLPCFNSAHE